MKCESMELISLSISLQCRRKINNSMGLIVKKLLLHLYLHTGNFYITLQ